MRKIYKHIRFFSILKTEITVKFNRLCQPFSFFFNTRVSNIRKFLFSTGCSNVQPILCGAKKAFDWKETGTMSPSSTSKRCSSKGFGELQSDFDTNWDRKTSSRFIHIFSRAVPFAWSSFNCSTTSPSHTLRDSLSSVEEKTLPWFVWLPGSSTTWY